jgi:hypothetical protein
LDLSITGLQPAHKGLLHNILGIRGVAQHTIGNRKEQRPVLVEDLRCIFWILHVMLYPWHIFPVLYHILWRR